MTSARWTVMGILFLSLAFAGLAMASGEGVPRQKNGVEIKDGWIYVQGERFFVKGVGYGGWRPGQSPERLDQVDLALADHDFRMIREAGFNTIRTAGGLTPELIALARKHGLMVMHGIWFDKNIDYRKKEQLEYATGMVRENVTWAKDFDNILMYLVANEFPVENVMRAGGKGTAVFLKGVRDAVRSVDHSKPVAMADWIATAFVDNSFWEAACFNAYIYSPTTIMYAMGYEQYIEWLKRTMAQGRPLIITEFGLSVSPSSRGAVEPGFFRYGGNTPQEQAEGLLRMYDDIIEAGAQGACVHEWIDAWWRPGDPSDHGDDPEKWFGIVGIDGKGSDPAGTPRPAFEALKAYNQALVLEPKRTRAYQETIPIEVYATEKVSRLQARINNGSWADLVKEGNFWWKGRFDTAGLGDGEQSLEIQALSGESVLVHKRQGVLLVRDPKGSLPLLVDIVLDKEKYVLGEKMMITVRVKGHDGKSVAGQKVDYGFFQPDQWSESKGTGLTDKNGELKISFVADRSGPVVISAGVAYQMAGVNKRAGDIRIAVAAAR